MNGPRPLSDRFLDDFSCILGAISASIFLLFPQWLKSMKSMTVTHFDKFLAFKNLSFFTTFSIDFSSLFQKGSGSTLLVLKVPVYTKKSDLGALLKFPWPQKSSLGAPFSRKEAPKSPVF